MQKLIEQLEEIQKLHERLRNTPFVSSTRYDDTPRGGQNGDKTASLAMSRLEIRERLDELTERVLMRFENLTELEQKVITMRGYGISVREIADQLFYSKDYVYKVLNMAKAKLADAKNLGN